MGGEKSLHSGEESEVVSTPQAPCTTVGPTLMHPWHLQQVSWKERATAVQDPLELPKKLAHSLPTPSSQHLSPPSLKLLLHWGLYSEFYKHHVSILALTYTPSSLYEIRSPKLPGWP